MRLYCSCYSRVAATVVGGSECALLVSWSPTSPTDVAAESFTSLQDSQLAKWRIKRGCVGEASLTARWLHAPCAICVAADVMHLLWTGEGADMKQIVVLLLFSATNRPTDQLDMNKAHGTRHQRCRDTDLTRSRQEQMEADTTASRGRDVRRRQPFSLFRLFFRSRADTARDEQSFEHALRPLARLSSPAFRYWDNRKRRSHVVWLCQLCA